MTGEPCQVCGGAAAVPLVSQNGHRSYIEGYLKKFDKKMRRSRLRARKLAYHMRGTNLLDVGSNIGCMVEAGRELGLDAVGVEINPVLVDFARERFPYAEFIAGTLEDAEFGSRRFDGVYCSEVIEHVPDNRGFVDAIAAVMAPGAVLFLTTPALREYVGKGDPSGWRDFGAPDHKLYHSPDTIRRLLRGHGFDRVKVEFNFNKGLKVWAWRADR